MARPKAEKRTVTSVTPAEIAPSPPADRFAELYDVAQEWFYQPDHQALRVLLGAMKAHYLSLGDPAWLFVVAPPGTGKTTLGIMGAASLPEVVLLGGFTACTFLSGFYGRKEPGLLEKLGQTTQDRRTFTTIGNAILLAKDFTTVLAMRRETRSEVLGQLRNSRWGVQAKFWYRRNENLARSGHDHCCGHSDHRSLLLHFFCSGRALFAASLAPPGLARSWPESHSATRVGRRDPTGVANYNWESLWGFRRFNSETEFSSRAAPCQSGRTGCHRPDSCYSRQLWQQGDRVRSGG